MTQKTTGCINMKLGEGLKDDVVDQEIIKVGADWDNFVILFIFKSKSKQDVCDVLGCGGEPTSLSGAGGGDWGRTAAAPDCRHEKPSSRTTGWGGWSWRKRRRHRFMGRFNALSWRSCSVFGWPPGGNVWLPINISWIYTVLEKPSLNLC